MHAICVFALIHVDRCTHTHTCLHIRIYIYTHTQIRHIIIHMYIQVCTLMGLVNC